MRTGSASICLHFAVCPIFECSSTDDSMEAYISQYCKGDFEACARKKLKDAGEPVPRTIR